MSDATRPPRARKKNKMPNIKLVIEVTLDDVNHGGFIIDQKTLSKIPTGGSMEIDLQTVDKSMSHMANQLSGETPQGRQYHK